MSTRVYRILLVLIPVVSAGCGGSYHKVEGTVTMDGAPVEKATVLFIPTKEGGQSATGQTDASGKFKLNNPSNDKGIPAGTYKVVITKGDPASTPASGGADLSDPTKAMEEFFKNQKKDKRGMPIPPEAKSELPVKYTKQDTTPLEVTIPASGAINLILEK